MSKFASIYINILLSILQICWLSYCIVFHQVVPCTVLLRRSSTFALAATEAPAPETVLRVKSHEYKERGDQK